MVENVVERAVRSIVVGLIAGILVGLTLWIVEAVITNAGQSINLNPSMWGLIVGVLVALYSFVTNRR